MDADRYQAPEVGVPLRVGSGEAAYWAFAPANLPRQVDLESRTIYLLSAADRAVGALSGFGTSSRTRKRMSTPFSRCANVAIFSSGSSSSFAASRGKR
jgi:hypothetical protein